MAIVTLRAPGVWHADSSGVGQTDRFDYDAATPEFTDVPTADA